MDNIKVLEELANAVIDGDDELAVSSAKAALENNLDPLQAVEGGLSKGMDVIGRQFESGEVFLPELLMAANAFNAAMDILKPELEAQKKSTTKLGTVLLGTVKGDLHNIGKNIVATVLETNGFEVIDIGIDNSPLTFIEQAEKAKIDIIGLSCLMTTTMPAQREVIQTLYEMNLRDKYKVIVGGGPVTQEWADQIGADGYSESAIQAVNLVKGLLETS
jgi:trimethylamine corrinoid protein